MVKCLPEFEYFTVFLKNRNFILKIKKSKVTDYLAFSDKEQILMNRFLYLSYSPVCWAQMKYFQA